MQALRKMDAHSECPCKLMSFTTCLQASEKLIILQGLNCGYLSTYADSNICAFNLTNTEDRKVCRNVNFLIWLSQWEKYTCSKMIQCPLRWRQMHVQIVKIQECTKKLNGLCVLLMCVECLIYPCDLNLSSKDCQ